MGLLDPPALSKTQADALYATPAQASAAAAAALAANSTVASAAVTAVNNAAAGGQLVTTTDARLGQYIGEVPGWESVVTDSTGIYVLSGVLSTGQPYNYFDSSEQSARPLDDVTIPGYTNVVLDSTGTWVLSADLADGSKYFHSLHVDQIDIAGSGATRTAAIALFGDSMIGDNAGIGTSVGAQVGIELGLPSLQAGVPGQTSTEAAFRAGGMELWGTITGNIIPTTGAVAVTITTPTGMWKTGSAWTFAATVQLADGTLVPGTLAKATDDSWSFTATNLTAATAAPREVRFQSDQATTYGQWGYVFRAGRNNIDQPTILRDYIAVRDWVYATQARPRFLAIPLYNPTDAPAGSATYNTYMAINAALAQEFGPDFYDLRRWLIHYGLDQAGLTPTSQDLTDISNDTVPTQLRQNGTDATHLSAAGRIAEAKQIAYVIKSRGWFA